MKIKNKVIHRIEIGLNENLSVMKIKEERFNVIGENKERICIDDWRFTTLDTVKVKRGNHQFYNLVGQIHVRDYMKDKYFKSSWGAFVIEVYHYGMSKKILQNQINKAVNKYINDKIGCYLILGRCNIKII